MKFVFKIQLFFSLHFVKVVSWIRTSSVLAGFFRKYFTTWKRSKNYLIEISSNKLIIQKNSLILPTMENPGCQIFSTILLALHVVPRYGVLQACDVFFFAGLWLFFFFAGLWRFFCRPVTFFFLQACEVFFFFFFLKDCDVFFFFFFCRPVTFAGGTNISAGLLSPPPHRHHSYCWPLLSFTTSAATVTLQLFVLSMIRKIPFSVLFYLCVFFTSLMDTHLERCHLKGIICYTE